MKRTILFSVLVIFMMSVNAQTHFRSGIFLHHSTGDNIWGPNGSATSIPEEMTAYNTAHSLTGNDTVTMNEEWWSPSDNEWSTQHAFFEDPSLVTGIGYYFPANKIIVIKSCFPSSSMTGTGQASDTLNPTDKTVYNYKWHWRHIVNVMKTHPDHFFVIWTNAPLEVNSTNLTEAGLSDQFCTWAKDTLAQGLDPIFGAFPDNVYVFDFFHKLVDTDGIMQSGFCVGSGDSHPNATATALVAPQFVEEIFDAALYYETIYLGISQNRENIASVKLFPNPCNSFTNIQYSLNSFSTVKISVYDIHGRLVKEISDQEQNAGIFNYCIATDQWNNGVYYCVIKATEIVSVIKLVVSE